MRNRGDGGLERLLAALAGVAAVAGAVVATARDHELLAATSLAGLAGVLAWYLAARRFDRRLDEQRRQLDEQQRALELTRERLEAEVAEERRVHERLERCRKLENEWADELRRQVMEAHREVGMLGDPWDLRQLVLRVAIQLVNAEKGLLLAREDLDGDGDLDLVCQEGFRNDPGESAIAQRFAGRVLDHDEIVKEDDPTLHGNEGRADEEIDNLVAIPIYMHDRFSGVVVCANRPGGFEELEDEVLLSLGDQAGAVLHSARLRGELRDAYLATVGMLADAIEAKDPFLRTHGDDSARYVDAVAERLELDPRRREELVFASLLHDVGKIGITERILLKPSALSAEERSVVQLHPRIGYRIVEQVPALKGVATAVLHHHERYDGDGYPSGLRGEEIPIEARLVAIADAFSAMTSDRPYRDRRSTDDALAELEACAGSQFDPELVRLFVEEVRKDPPLAEGKAMLAQALSDPEIETRRRDGEPVLGWGSAARTDNLTLLYSHRHAREAVDAEAERATLQGNAFAVVLVEVVDLDQLNHDEGYAAGDEALRTVADVVQAAAADCGGTACRFSGTRMLLLAPNVAARGADRIRDEITAALGDGPKIRCGHVIWRPGESGDDVLARARLDLETARLPAA